MTNYPALVFTSIAMAALASICLDNDSSLQGNLRRNVNQPKTVNYVDLNRYSGKWYEQAVIPYFFEIGCSNTIAKYSLNDEGLLRFQNSCMKNGKLDVTIGKGIPQDNTNAKLTFKFSLNSNAQASYWIVRLAEDYSYAVVSNPTYTNLWILTRGKKIHK